VIATQANGAQSLTVTVSDEEAADAQLLRALLQVDDLTITGFGRKQYNLEEVFLGLVDHQESK
jgi:hypothetical protein